MSLRKTAALFLISAFVAANCFAQVAESVDEVKIPWTLTVVVMDGVDAAENAEKPVSEAIAFIEARTKFAFEVKYVQDYSSHEFTPYPVGPDNDGDGRGDETAFLMMGWNLSKSTVRSLPPSMSYLFLYKLFDRRPLQAGSTVGLKFGLRKGGKLIPYATVPTDQWWYVNEPHEGFNSRAAQIITHELVNVLQAKLEAAPFRCAKLTASFGLPGNEFEAERLTKLNDSCYAKLNRGVR